MLSVSRNIPRAAERYRRNDYSIDGMEGVDLEGKTIGIAGTGSIGFEDGPDCKGPRHATSVAYDVVEDKKAEERIGFRYVSLEKLLQESDVVSLHLPLTDKTISPH